MRQALFGVGITNRRDCDVPGTILATVLFVLRHNRLIGRCVRASSVVPAIIWDTARSGPEEANRGAAVSRVRADILEDRTSRGRDHVTGRPVTIATCCE